MHALCIFFAPFFLQCGHTVILEKLRTARLLLRLLTVNALCVCKQSDTPYVCASNMHVCVHIDTYISAIHTSTSPAQTADRTAGYLYRYLEYYCTCSTYNVSTYSARIHTPSSDSKRARIGGRERRKKK